MADYKHAMIRFLNKSIEVGEKIHEDSKNAEKVFKKIKSETDFESIILQTKSQRYIDESHAFARVLKDWSELYPTLLTEFKQVLELVIRELRQIQGMNIVIRRDNTCLIRFNENVFRYRFSQNFPGQAGTFQVDDSQKGLLAKKENKIVQEIAEIISLYLHVEKFMEYMGSLTQSMGISNLAAQVLQSEINSPRFVSSMHNLAIWWIRVRETLTRIKELTYTAVEMDKDVAKKLGDLFAEEERKKLKDKHLIVAKSGLTIARKIALSMVPGGGIIDIMADLPQVIKKTKKDLEDL